MEAIKLVLMLLLVLVVTEAKSARHSHRCSDNIRGRECAEDAECACANNQHSKLICNYRLKCQRSGFLDKIMRRQPCFRVYKSWCSIDVDCPPCDEAPLICEQNECVKARYIVA